MTFHAQADTDGAFLIATEDGRLVPCPGGPEVDDAGRACIRSLSFAEVQARRERFALIARWTRLPIPHDCLEGRRVIVGEGSPSIFKREATALDADGRLADCLTYSPGLKRFLQWQTGDPESFKASEAAIGPMLNPSGLTSRVFARACWEFLAAIDEGGDLPDHEWLDLPTIYPEVVRPEELERAQRAIPDLTAFETVIYAKSLVGGRSFVTRLNTDPGSWANIDWFTEGGVRVRITTGPDAGRANRRDTGRHTVVSVRTWRVFLRSLLRNPVPLTLGPDGHPCGRQTRGLLRPRPVLLLGADVVGRTGWAQDRKAPVFLRDPGHWRRALDVVAGMSENELRGAGLAPSTVRALRAGRTPSPRTAVLVERVALQLAEDLVVGDGPTGTPRGQTALVAAIETRRCEAPNRENRLIGRQRRWCSLHGRFPGSRRKGWKLRQSSQESANARTATTTKKKGAGSHGTNRQRNS